MSTGVTIKGGYLWKDALKKIADQKATLKVGVLSGKYSGESGTNTGLSVAQVAFWNEYGTSRIPARPAFRMTLKEKRNAWINTFTHKLQGHPLGVEAALWLLGDVMAKDIQLTVKQSVPPPSAESTIAQKQREHFSEPTATLIRTGAYIKSISSQVSKTK